MYKAVVSPMLLYEAETLTVCKKQARGLNHFYVCCLRRILRLRFQDRIPDMDELERARIFSIYAMLRQLQLRWSDHHVRMDDERLPKRLFYGDAATASAAPVSSTPINTTHNFDTPTDCNTTAIVNTIDEDLVYTCPNCDRTFTSHIGLVIHLRFHRTETDEPVLGSPTYTRCTRLHCPHCPRTFMHRMGLFGHMRIHESGIGRSPDTPNTSNTSTMPGSANTPPSSAPTTNSITRSTSCTRILLGPPSTPFPSAPTTTSSTIAEADIDTVDFSCPHCPRTIASRIGPIGHLRIHRTEPGEPVPRRIRPHCPHCARTFIHHMGL
ncbi:hypothetical protein SprV_0100191700 [Sparganum proliferum]